MVNNLSFMQKQYLFKRLEEELEYVGQRENRQVTYRSGEDDQWLANAISGEARGFPCTKANVLGLRKECFGELFRGRVIPVGNSAEIAFLQDRVFELESRYRALWVWLQSEYPMSKSLAKLQEAWND